MLRAMSSDDDARWAEAQSILDRSPTPSAEQRLRRWRNGRWALVAALLVVGSAVGVLVSVVLTGSSGAEAPEPSAAQQAVGFWISGAGYVLAIVGFVLLVRGGVFRAWRQPITVLDRGQRRQLAAQARGRAAVDPARLPLARDLARRLIDQTRQWVMLSGLAVGQVGLAIATPKTWRVLTSSGLAVLCVVGAALAVRDARRARRFLDEHPEPVAEGATER